MHALLLFMIFSFLCILLKYDSYSILRCHKSSSVGRLKQITQTHTVRRNVSMAWRRSSRLTELAFIIRDVATVGIVLLGGLPTISRNPPVTQHGEPTHLHTDRLTAIESSAHSYMRNTQERVTRATGPRQKVEFFVQ